MPKHCHFIPYAFAAPLAVSALWCKRSSMYCLRDSKHVPRRQRYWHLPIFDQQQSPICGELKSSTPVGEPKRFEGPPVKPQSSASLLEREVLPAEFSAESSIQPSNPAPARQAPMRKKTQSAETRRKISLTMQGVPKSAAMRAKLSASMKALLKTRSVWNKGKSLSAETRRRMSESRRGRTSWNKGVSLSQSHRNAISSALQRRKLDVSDATRRLLQLARRRPGDAIVAGGGSVRGKAGEFPLVETADINAYVSLRRALRGWSDSFAVRNGRRPTLADVRRVAPPQLVRDFESYVRMRDSIRGLAVDVYGSVNPGAVPVIPVCDSATSGPRNNNAGRRVHLTKRGNARLRNDIELSATQGSQISRAGSDGPVLEALGVHDSRDDMWDRYDAPVRRPDRASGFGVDRSLFGIHEIGAQQTEHGKHGLSMNDYRMIGRYRLMESKDICAFVQVRRELESWSVSFKKRTGHIPRLSDVKDQADSGLYSKFCRYLDMRQSMSGLMKEVYGANMDDFQSTIDEVNEAGRSVLDVLRASVSRGDAE